MAVNPALQQQGSFLCRKIPALLSVTSKNGVSLRLAKQLQRAAAGGERPHAETLRGSGKKQVPRGHVFQGIQREPTSGIPKSARPGKLLPAWLRASTQHAWMVGVGGAECGTQGCNPENWGKTPGVSFH